MDEKMQITDSEMRVMEIIWKYNEMMRVPDILEKLQDEGEEWAYQTVATFLRRLEGKGVLGCTKKDKKLLYYPLMSKEQFQKKEARGFVDSKFDGSLKNFLFAFTGQNKLKESDIKELREWLDGLDH